MDWEPVVAWPAEGPERMFALVSAQHDGFRDRLFVFGGRKFADPEAPSAATLEFGCDCWSLDPTHFDPGKFDTATGSYEGKNPWKRLADAPVPCS